MAAPVRIPRMGPSDLLLAPVRAVRAVARAADDLNAIAERARREPDPVEELQVQLDQLLAVAQTIVTGGEDLRQTGEKLDGHAAELIDGGADLTDTAKLIESHLRVFRAALPRIMETLGVVEQLEDAVETVADTIEPLQDVTNGVGRVARRLSPAS